MIIVLSLAFLSMFSLSSNQDLIFFFFYIDIFFFYAWNIGFNN